MSVSRTTTLQRAVDKHVLCSPLTGRSPDSPEGNPLGEKLKWGARGLTRSKDNFSFEFHTRNPFNSSQQNYSTAVEALTSFHTSHAFKNQQINAADATHSHHTAGTAEPGASDVALEANVTYDVFVSVTVHASPLAPISRCSCELFD